MDGAAVTFDGVWKKFRRGERHDSLRDLIPSLAKQLWKRSEAELEAEEFWALKDVSFEVKPGEALGIIGPNGAGKSTVLKLLTKILKPTRGRCEVRGRVGALIEVAAGFHPDLTGRENIFLQGAIMGMKQREIARKLDDIIEFAGVREFIDTPVKRYSSGMNARLGFSIAAHLDPEVLLIDEVLAVGDMAFQEKCFRRMAAFKESGAAVVLISHNLQAVATLCDRALHLRRGEVRECAETGRVLGSFIAEIGGSQAGDTAADVQIVACELIDEFSKPVSGAIRPGERLRLRVRYRFRRELSNITFGFRISRSNDRLVVYDGHILDRELNMGSVAPLQTVTVDFAFRAHLARGHYELGCHVYSNPLQKSLAQLSPAAYLTVSETRTYAGVADVELAPVVVKELAPAHEALGA